MGTLLGCPHTVKLKARSMGGEIAWQRQSFRLPVQSNSEWRTTFRHVQHHLSFCGQHATFDTQSISCLPRQCNAMQIHKPNKLKVKLRSISCLPRQCNAMQIHKPNKLKVKLPILHLTTHTCRSVEDSYGFVILQV